jgi:acetyl-CoA carboxylase carboxyl transferase subunit beta
LGWLRKSKKTVAPAGKREELWTRCPSCEAHVFREEWEKSIKVCPKCNFHDRLTCRERIDLLIDRGTFSERDKGMGWADPLDFEGGGVSYNDKASQAEEKTGLREAVLSGRGKVNGTDIAIVVMDFRFMGGSLGSVTGELILQATHRALRHKIPLVIVSASGGARMQEGMFSLMQMAKTCAGVARLHANHLPYISILTHPTMGGVSASYSMVGDVNISEPGALIGFAGRRVIEQTIKQKLPDGFQTAEYLLEHGFLDLIVPRSEMKARLASLLAYGVNKRVRKGA